MNKIYLENRSFLRKFIAVLVAGLFTCATMYAQYINGNLSTGATATGGGAAPAGFTWSELQPGSGTFGFSASITGGVRIADDFTVPAGQTWNLTSMVFYGYQTNYAGATSPFTTVRVSIHSGTVTGPVVFGDQTTNRFASSTTASMYRIANATPGTARQIWSITATTVTSLAPGTYWIEYATDVTGGAAHFLPPSTVVGTTTQAGDNAQQNTGTGWVALLDGTFPQDMPFKINYTATGAACTGTPAPGNTVSTIATGCAGSPFTLSTQNATTGLGVTYQWQSGPSATGPWTNIAGATNSTYSSTVSASTYYQVLVTCSGNTGTSTPTQVALTPPSGCYCTPAASNCSLDDEIQNVTFAGINNNSTCSANGYASYIAGTPASVIVGGTYPISVTIGPGGGDVLGVWIDYNHSGSFEPTEFTLIGTTPGGTVTNNVAIPASALTGPTRMRVRSHFSGAMAGTEPCTTYTYGETEDYTVNINPCVPMQITSNPTDQSITCGGNATYSVATSGSLPTYQWEYRTSSSGIWQNVPNAAPYSGVNTNTLTITGANASLNGYQYRALVSGACAGATPSTAANLTINAIAATVTPATATICTGTVQPITLTNTLGNVILLNEAFNTGVPATWPTTNNSSPIGPTNWGIGDPTNFGVTSHSGAPNAYVASNYGAAAIGVANTISNWLFTPQVSIKNGDVLTFWSRIPTLAQSGGVEYPDRLEVRMSTNGASTNVGATATTVGDFSNLLLTINPTLTTGVYPQAWTQYTVTVSGVTGTVNGRFAFRAWENDNGSGSNEDYIALDDVVYTSTGAAAQGVFTGPAGTIFTNAAGTTPYTGTPATTVYVTPAVGTSTYSVSFTTPVTGCVSTTATSVITVNSVATGTPAVASITTCANTNAVFAVTGITGGTGLTYQWQVSTLAVPAFTNIAGATSSTYTVASPSAAQNGNKYRVIVGTGGCAASLTSTAGTLTVNPIPVVTITAAPVVNIFPGLTSTLTAAVSSATTPLSYQWYLNGSPVAGATANTYTVGVDQEGTYSVSVTDANGCTSAAGTSTPNSITIGDSSGVTILFIYPSPNSGRFQVRYFNDINNGGTAPAIVNVYDEKGARVYTNRYVLGGGYNAMNVDMGTHGRGLYRVELLDLNGNRIKTGSVMVF